MSEDICGSENTTSGEPCRFSPGESCPYHGTDDPPDNGRPTKLTYERQEAIAADVENGKPLVAACRMNGITHDTHRNWMRRGQEQEEGPYADYFRRLARALGYDQSEKTDALWRAAVQKGDTKAMLTILKQRYPETWQDMDIGEAQGAVPFEIPDEVKDEWAKHGIGAE